MPLSSIRDVPRQGRVRVRGVIAGEPTLVAPMTGRPCSLYSVEMVEWDNGATYPFLDVGSAEALELVDGEEHAIVEPQDASFILPKKRRMKGHNFSDFEGFRRFAAAHGVSAFDAEGIRRSVQWRETILVPGDRITVIGSIAWEAEGAATYRDTGVRLALRSAAGSPLIIAGGAWLG